MAEQVLTLCNHDLPDAETYGFEVWRCGLCGLYYRAEKHTHLSPWDWYQYSTASVREAIALKAEVRGE